MKSQDIITDFAIEFVFTNTNFGGQAHRDVVDKNLKQVNDGYWIGRTAQICLLELGLIKGDSSNGYVLTCLGNEYLKTIKTSHL